MHQRGTSPDTIFQAMTDNKLQIRSRTSKSSGFVHKLRRVVKKFYFKRSLRSYQGHSEQTEYETFARTCTHRHGSSQSHLPRTTEELTKKTKVHFLDEDFEKALYSPGSKSMPSTKLVEGLMRRWLDPNDHAEPGMNFRRVCPVTSSYVADIKRSGGINDWAARAGTLVALNDARVPMLKGCTRDDALMNDLQALQMLYCVVESMGIYGVPSW